MGGAAPISHLSSSGVEAAPVLCNPTSALLPSRAQAAMPKALQTQPGLPGLPPLPRLPETWSSSLSPTEPLRSEPQKTLTDPSTGAWSELEGGLVATEAGPSQGLLSQAERSPVSGYRGHPHLDPTLRDVKSGPLLGPWRGLTWVSGVVSNSETNGFWIIH